MFLLIFMRQHSHMHEITPKVIYTDNSILRKFVIRNLCSQILVETGQKFLNLKLTLIVRTPRIVTAKITIS